jgi:hypothetical protein
MSSRQVLTDMTMGELSRRLLGRWDLQAYYRGALEITNGVPFFPGGFTYRPGFIDIGAVKGTGKARLREFIVSPTVSYLLEIGPLYIRFWRAGALVGGGPPVEIVTNWSETTVASLQFAQDGASLYIASGTGPVKVLSMTSFDAFEFADIIITGNEGMLPFQGTGNYPHAIVFHDGRLWLARTDNDPQGIWASKPFEYGDFTYYETIEATSTQYREPYNEFSGNTTAGNTTIGGIDADELEGFKVGDRISGPGIVSKDSVNFVAATTAGSHTLTGVSSGVISQLSVGEQISGQNIPVTTITGLGTNSITMAWVATGTSATNTMTRAQRRTTITSIGETSIAVSIPATATATGASLVDGWADPTIPEYRDVTTSRDVVTSSSAMKKAIAGASNETILWLASGRDLIVGTTTGERVVPSGVNAITFSCRRQTAIGSAAIQPIMVNASLLFVGSSAQNVQEYLYDSGTEAYQSPDLNSLADHILTAGVKEIDYQSGQRPVLWVTRADGVIAGCAYNRVYDLAAWFTIQHGAGLVESLAVIPENGVDTLYAAVNRSGARRIEKLGPLFGSTGHLDSSGTATVAAGQITGLERLNGTACLVHDGVAHTITIAAGASAVPEGIPDGAVVQVGVRAPMRFKTMPLHPQAQMIDKTIVRVAARLLDSYPFRVGYDGGTMELASFEGPFTGDHDIGVFGSWDKQGTLVIEQDDPFDLTVLAIAPVIDAGGY